ncbi:hypothetical protein LCGC14_1660640 [marine sediment metagenome]|uniref:AAA+ ATPase domain-containing protein n=1 Tax=marine sediment metagenome TaxID=412755 RepID=A0A0F9HUV2_9ZZZZ
MMPLINYYIPPEIKAQLDNSKKIVKEADQDRIFIITGREGSGKSWLAMQLAAYLDPTFCLDDVCFDSNSFGKRIREVDKLKAIIFDEAFSGLSSKGSLSKENKKLIKILIECRQRNLFLFIVLPSIFILDRYITLFRSHSLFNTAISRKNFNNRYYKVYNYENKHKLYILGQKYMSYSKPKIWKKYRFYGKLPLRITKEEYQKKKSENFKEKEIEEDPALTRVFIQRDTMIRMLKDMTKITLVDIAKALEEVGQPITSVQVGRIVRKPQKTT